MDDKQKEAAKLIEQVTGLIDSGFSNTDVNELADLTLELMILNDERIRDIEKENKQTSDNMKILQQRLQEYETSLALVETFLLENGLYEEFLAFSDEVIQDFAKEQKLHLTLVQ